MEAMTAEARTASAPAASPPSDYWSQAYNSLDEEARDNLGKVKHRFNSDTRKAISALLKALDTETVDKGVSSKLREMMKNQRYKDLSIEKKGKLQLLARNVKKTKFDHRAVATIDCMATPSAEEAMNPSRTPLSDLLEMCEQKQKLAEARKWKFSFPGRQDVFIGDVWKGVLDKVDKLKPVIDVVTKVDSKAELVWSVIKVVLDVCI